jgi:hypothetical protein
MWVLGLLLLYGFYCLIIVWYLPLYISHDPFEKPIGFMYMSYHHKIRALGFVLFAAACTFFFLSNPWLLLVPFAFTGYSIARLRRSRQIELQSLLVKAIDLQVQMERKGTSQSDISKAIISATTGTKLSDDWDGSNWDLKSVVKFYVLKKFYDTDAVMKSFDSISESERFDALIDYAYEIRKKQI